MAGIVGVIGKNILLREYSCFDKLKMMLRSISLDEEQQSTCYTDDFVMFGNVIPISTKVNNRFVYCDRLECYCIIDGYVYVDKDIKKIVVKKYGEIRSDEVYDYLPYLYDLYQCEVVHYLSGSYNVFIYDKRKGECLLFNDRLGYSPLYIYEDSRVVMFSSKIEGILSSGLMDNIDFDLASFAEHYLFNYLLSDNTYIKGIETLGSATCWLLSREKNEKHKYWDVSTLFGKPALSKKSSFELFNDSLRRSINKILDSTNRHVNFSLTGGWDSRLLLSYIMNKSDQLKLFSFGAPNSFDIEIPVLIANKENLDYIPIMLDQKYLDEKFVSFAKDTIILSGGTRSYKRAHYLYASQEMSKNSDVFISGIFGDQTLKVGKFYAGAVISRNFLKLQSSQFDIRSVLSQNSNNNPLAAIKICLKDLTDDLQARIDRVKKGVCRFKEDSMNNYAFRMELNLRKYFGNEISSYNDYGYSHSPFIDAAFINDYAKTIYFYPRYGVKKSSVLAKYRSTKLYSDLICSNYLPLANYDSARNYSMQDVYSKSGMLKIFMNRYIDGNKKDTFNTDKVDEMFYRFAIGEGAFDTSIYDYVDDRMHSNVDNINTLIYWSNYICDKYL